jgi:hypothetical protein
MCQLPDAVYISGCISHTTLLRPSLSATRTSTIMRSTCIVLALASMAVAALPIIEPVESRYHFTLLHTTITLTSCLDIAVRNPEPQRNAQADYYKRDNSRNGEADYYKRDP